MGGPDDPPARKLDHHDDTAIRTPSRAAPVRPAPIANVAPSPHGPARIARAFRALLQSGARLRPAGDARRDPAALLRGGYTPKHALDLFGTRFFLTNLRIDDDFRFFVAYVHLARDRDKPPSRQSVYPRIFYKDSSLIWRSASHFIASDKDQWIGKGDLKPVRPGDDAHWASAEETTNLPLEMQAALDEISRRAGKARSDRRAIALVLRRAPDGRIAPYADFSRPRAQAMARPGGRVNGGHYVAWFEREGEPESLRFASGFEPDLARGLIDTSHSRSALYGGAIAKFRFASRNGQIQYLLVAGPRNVWIVPPQTLTRDLTPYGVRPIDVPADEDLFLPGYEFHYPATDDGDWHSQIPEGFAGAPNELDPSRVDTSAWNDRLPIVREFRRAFL